MSDVYVTVRLSSANLARLTLLPEDYTVFDSGTRLLYNTKSDVDALRLILLADGTYRLGLPPAQHAALGLDVGALAES